VTLRGLENLNRARLRRATEEWLRRRIAGAGKCAD
jgi:hypothetical protein